MPTSMVTARRRSEAACACAYRSSPLTRAKSDDPPPYIDLTISSTIFFASANSIMVLSRKKSSFSMPA